MLHVIVVLLQPNVEEVYQLRASGIAPDSGVYSTSNIACKDKDKFMRKMLFEKTIQCIVLCHSGVVRISVTHVYSSGTCHHSRVGASL